MISNFVDALKNCNLLIVGSGLYGLTIAERAADSGFKVVIIESRPHIGGNAYSYLDEETQIEVHKYGSHLFHTSNLRVFEYISRFTQLNNYRHKVFTQHQNEIYQLPINLHTLSQFYKKAYSPTKAKEYFEEFHLNAITNVDNFESKAINTIGLELYSAFIYGYTKKQWGMEPRDLPKEVFSRLPVRMNFNNDYFDDKWQGLPLKGYQELFKSMLKNQNISIFTETNYFEIQHLIPKELYVCYTGPIDKFFNYKYGLLGWRTLDFETEILNIGDFQGAAVMNYSDLDIKYTRIHEFKHLHPERNYQNKTFIMKEYSRISQEKDEPYYPINSREDKEKLIKYRIEINKLTNYHFGGRLGSYQYLDMHMAIAAALTDYDNSILIKLKIK